MQIKNKYKINRKSIVNGIAAVIAVAGIATAIKMNLVGRSLWYDEAALAYSFSQRSLGSLTSTPLDVYQSAPAGWLYLLKIFTLLFGNTDFLLRVPSIIFYVGILVLTYLIAKQVFSVEFPMLPVAFTASIPIVLQYANVFKPYICDGFVTLLAIWLFFLYDRKKLHPLVLAIGWGILIWISNPVCFVQGGFLVVAGIESLWKKDGKKCKELILIGVCIVASFAGEYFYWLRPAATGGSMQGFWANYKFPILLTSKADWEQMRAMLSLLFSQFYRSKWVIFFLLIVGFFYALYKKEKMLLGIYVSFGIALVASSVGMFPINKRLWLFFYPMAVLAVFAAVGMFLKDLQRKQVKGFRICNALILLVGVFACVLNAGIRYYWNSENVYWPRYEYKAEYEYLQSVIEDENVYVFSGAYPGFLYYNDYNDVSLEDKGNALFIGYLPLGESNDCTEDMNFILSSEKCYIFMSDTWNDWESTAVLFTETHQNGYMEMVYFDHETPLWYYCQSSEDTKSRVQLQVTNRESTGDGNLVYTVELINTGETYLNPEFETLQLVSSDGTIAVDLPKMIAPGASVELQLTVPEDAAVSVHLQNEYGNVCEDNILELKE
jgi:hypothetical protein